MSVGSDIREKPGPLAPPAERRHATFPCESVPYVLSTADAAIIMLSSLIGGTLYQWSIGNPMPNLLPHCAVGLLASFIHILRISGGGYYDDVYVKTPTGWRFKSRTHHAVLSEGRRVK